MRIQDRLISHRPVLAKNRRAVLFLAWLVCATIGCGGDNANGNRPTAGQGGATGDQGQAGDAANRAGQRNGATQKPEKRDLARGGPRRSRADAPAILLELPDFEFTDQAGNPFGSRELRGKVWVGNFMFTRCQATCPRQSSQLAELQRHASRWPDWQRVRFVSFTVDPEHDTTSRLREYAREHNADPAHWKFLTGSRAALWSLSKDGFKLPVGESSAQSTGPFTHSPRYILVDAHLRVRGFYDSTRDHEINTLVNDLRAVLSEPGADPSETIHLGLPHEVFYAPWLEQRQAEQLAAADAIDVFHDFKFTDRREESGIRFVNRAVGDSARHWKMNHYDHANGVIAADVDQDGLPDLYFMSQVGGNQLWRNLGGGRFENITERAGVALDGPVVSSGAFADTDNDGDPDLFVTTIRFGNFFFENLGGGRFRDATQESGLAYMGHSSTADFFDYDNDGLLDLFVTNVGRFTTETVLYSGDPEKQEYPYYTGITDAFAGHLKPELDEASILYHNEGGNRFRDVSQAMGLADMGWNGDATPLDANDDGWIDLYVLNMQGTDEYYENLAGQRFEARGSQRFPAVPWGSMGVKSLDFDNDGRMDLFTTNMHADMWDKLLSGPGEKLKSNNKKMPPSYLKGRPGAQQIYGNALFHNQPDGQFIDVSDAMHAETYWPWGPSAGDLNADGYQDLFIASCMNLQYRYHPNSLLLNGRGKGFFDAEYVLGIEPRANFQLATPWFELECGGRDARSVLCEGCTGRVVVWGAIGTRSAVILDIDQDGDLDIVTNDYNSPSMLLVSNLAQVKPDLRYLHVALRGVRSNRDGLGAKVTVKVGEFAQTQVNDGQSGYLSQSSLPLYFGLADAQVVDQIVVQWPGGRRQIVPGPIMANQTLVIEEAADADGTQRRAPE